MNRVARLIIFEKGAAINHQCPSSEHELPPSNYFSAGGAAMLHSFIIDKKKEVEKNKKNPKRVPYYSIQIVPSIQ